jgi:ornithine--oxo-acid transaminase
MQEQCKKLTLCSRAFHNENLIHFYKYMHNMFGYDKCLPMNTGVEACETAIKLARLWGYKKKNIRKNMAAGVVAKNNFWGRSITACSSSTDPLCYENFGPYTGGFITVDYNDIEQLEFLFKKSPYICAFMVEPIQGEAGIIIPDKNYLYKVKKLCEKYNVLLICDEVQTGIGRTGNMLASSQVKPDIVVLGKALSGGMIPISCVLANNEIMDLLVPGSHGSTYGGNPLATAIAPDAINIIRDECLTKNAFTMGHIFRKELYEFVKNGILKDVRGVGLLNAIEFHDNKYAEKTVNKLRKNGLLTKITKDATIRMCPPLIINKFQMDESLNIIKKSII